jgi:predicted nucleic acid-binding protein
MIAVLDACVLYPTVLRQILLGCAEQGLYRPVWSERLLEEWRRAARRNGGDLDAAVAEAEIARANARMPKALTPPGDEVPLWLPDAADVHVLATAIASKADTIITLNLRDFPARELSGHGVMARPPDAILMELWLDAPDAVEPIVHAVHAEAERLSGETLPLRGLLKRARLPRLGKALAR